MGRIAEAALARTNWITAAALLLLTLIAWGWIVSGAGMDMAPHWALSPFPHRQATETAMAMGTMAMGASFGVLLAMWWVMMVAMMLPSAAPMVLLYARASSHDGTSGKSSTALFLLGYLVAWGLFSGVAALGQSWLQHEMLASSAMMALASRWLAAAVLIAAGAYQLSPLKNACLKTCRNPAAFLSRHHRPGRAGAMRLGVVHGAYCVGCCWMLMALLFVGGVMNLAWIALLTLLVAAEKILPHGRHIATVTGIGLIGWGVATLVV